MPAQTRGKRPITGSGRKTGRAFSGRVDPTPKHRTAHQFGRCTECTRPPERRAPDGEPMGSVRRREPDRERERCTDRNTAERDADDGSQTARGPAGPVPPSNDRSSVAVTGEKHQRSSEFGAPGGPLVD